jgi:hypothetical protein
MATGTEVKRLGLQNSLRGARGILPKYLSKFTAGSVEVRAGAGRQLIDALEWLVEFVVQMTQAENGSESNQTESSV